MAENMRPGQFYLDTINKDKLKILSLTFEVGDLSAAREGDPLPGVEYVRCACIANGSLLGVQEMRVTTLENPRFIRAPFLSELWLKWKWRNSKLNAGDVPRAPQGPMDQKATY